MMDSTMMDNIREAQGMMVQGRGKSSEERIDAGTGIARQPIPRFSFNETYILKLAVMDRIRNLWLLREKPIFRMEVKECISLLRKLRRLSRGY